MKYGLFSGCLWGLDTVILGIALTMVPFIGTAEALALGAIVSSALHDVCCALWLLLYMGVRGRLKDTLAALKTRSGKVVILGALLGGPIGMGYLSADTTVTGDPIIGLLGALAAVFGWGSEAVLCAWGMRDDAVDNETALQIRETTSALVYLVVVLPIFGAWAFTWNAIPNPGTAVVALAALFGLILLGTVPGPVEIVCCIAILCGTILAACDWGELFGTKKAEA